MILFFFETSFKLLQKQAIKNWLRSVASYENKKVGEINIIFHEDEFLLALNKQYLNHDTLTDIITFDNSEGNILNGDIYISIERVEENSKQFCCSFEEELLRVIVHGILHLCGYEDKSIASRKKMREKEEKALFNFKTQFNHRKDNQL